MHPFKIIGVIAAGVIVVGGIVFILSKTLGAQSLYFTTGEYDEDMRAVYNEFYRDNINAYEEEHPDATPTSVQFTRFDLNGDGAEELFAFVYGAPYCTESGCSLDLYERQDDSWRKIGEWKGVIPEFSDGESTIIVLPSKSQGYRDIMYAGVATYRWSGDRY